MGNLRLEKNFGTESTMEVFRSLSGRQPEERDRLKVKERARAIAVEVALTM